MRGRVGSWKNSCKYMICIGLLVHKIYSRLSNLTVVGDGKVQV